MINTPTNYYFPNRLGRILLFVLEEVMGKTGLNNTLGLSLLSNLIDNYPQDNNERSVSFDTISLLHKSLEQNYGPRGGRGLALRAGRVFFSHLVRVYGTEMGLTDSAFRLQPPDIKQIAVLNALAAFFNKETDQKVSLEENEQNVLWRIERCPWCWEQHGFEPTCHFAVGVLQEALYWVSGGRFYNVVEETCIAQGDSSCLFVVNRIPLS